MARARWDNEAREFERRLAAREEELPLRGNGLEEGELLGVLQWQERSGRVRRWVVRQSKRSNQIKIDGVPKPKCWSWLLARLRKHTACLTR
ncbi:MAG: hypothetical protein AAF555_05755 [Verrucomicrobiota bacterium]